MRQNFDIENLVNVKKKNGKAKQFGETPLLRPDWQLDGQGHL